MTNKSLLPNPTPLVRAHSETSAARWNLIDPNIIRRERDPAQCGAQFVAPLAWERSVHSWRDGDDAGNRARIASSFADHCSYGTPAALEREITLDTGAIVRIADFFEAGLQWPDFRISILVAPGDPTPDAGAVYASAIARRPPRDWPGELRIFMEQPPASLFMSAAARATTRARILPFAPSPPAPQIYLAAAARVYPQQRILPVRAA